MRAPRAVDVADPSPAGDGKHSMSFQDFRNCTVSGVLLLVAACTSGSAPPVESAVQTNAPTSEVAAPANAEAVAFLRGYYESRDGGQFTACGETSRRRVISVDPATAAALVQANAAQDRPRFLMAEGNLHGGDAVEIGRFNIISGDAWNCESRLGEIMLGARGIDALWSLEVTPAAATFVAGPNATPEVHAFAGLGIASDGLILNVDAADADFSAHLRAEACIEALTDTSFGWSIVVTAKDRSYEGCAWRGLAAP